MCVCAAVRVDLFDVCFCVFVCVVAGQIVVTP